MNFLFPIGFFAMGGAAAVLLIYLFQRRFRPRKVSALFLWEAALRRHGGGHKLSRLESSLLMFLELLCVCLLGFALASPGCRRTESMHRLVFVLDDSMSMSAENPSDGKSSRDRACEEIMSLLSKYQPFSASFIISGETPRTLASAVTGLREADLLLSRWRPGKLSHDLAPAIDFAFQISGECPCVYLATDQAPPCNEKGEPAVRNGLVWSSFGTRLDNLAFISASRRFNEESAKEEIFAEVANFSGMEREISLCAEQDGKTLFSRKFNAPPLNGAGSDTLRFAIEVPARLDQPVRLEIMEKDAIAADNRVLLLSEAESPVKVLVAMDESGDDGKLLGANLRKAFAAAGAVAAADSASAEIVATAWPAKIADDSDRWLLSIPSAGKRLAPFYGPYICDKDSPLTANLLLEGVKWTAFDVTEPEGYVPLISYKNTALLSELRNSQGGGRNLVLNYFASSSNMQRTPAWPILFLNILKERESERPGLHRRNFRAGEAVWLRIPRGDNVSANCISGGAEALPAIADGDSHVLFKAESPGLYELRFSQSHSLDSTFAVNFLCPEESDLSGLCSCIHGQENFRSMEYAVWRDFFWIFLLAAFLVALARLMMIAKEEGAMGDALRKDGGTP